MWVGSSVTFSVGKGTFHLFGRFGSIVTRVIFQNITKNVLLALPRLEGIGLRGPELDRLCVLRSILSTPTSLCLSNVTCRGAPADVRIEKLLEPLRNHVLTLTHIDIKPFHA